MSKFNLDNYEPVKARKKRFYNDFPDGRIIVEIVKADKDEAILKAMAFKNVEELEKRLPLATGYAQEIKGQGGMANKHAHLENCEESAIGRALDNAGYATDSKCSREEMIKVKRQETILSDLKDAILKEVKRIGAFKKKGWFKDFSGNEWSHFSSLNDENELQDLLKGLLEINE